MARIIDIEGIGPVWAEKLQNAGVNTTESLLGTAGSAAGRTRLAEVIGVPPARVLEWVNRADLMRVKGIGSEYADLLEEAGVDSCPELARRNAVNLHAKIVELNDTKKLVRQTPSAEMVARWIADADDLPKVVSH